MQILAWRKSIVRDIMVKLGKKEEGVISSRKIAGAVNSCIAKTAPLHHTIKKAKGAT